MGLTHWLVKRRGDKRCLQVFNLRHPTAEMCAMAYDAKTKPTPQSAASYLDAIDDEARRQDCKELAALMKKVTGCAPKMWGASIVGFDEYHYKYDSGHEGDSAIVGFSSRKGPISVYMPAGYDGAEDLLAQLGKYKVGKACLYVNRLADVKLAVLEKLLARAVVETKKRYPAAKQ
jgi:hypothetical protein